MSSLDNATDLIELFQSQTCEFLVVLVQKGKKQDKAITWFNYHTQSGKEMIGDTLAYLLTTDTFSMSLSGT